jgi:hypothetical protein
MDYTPTLSYMKFEVSILKMEAVCSSEASVPIYQTTWCYNPGHRNINITKDV